MSIIGPVNQATGFIPRPEFFVFCGPPSLKTSRQGKRGKTMRCLIHLKNEKSKFDGGTLTVDACTVRSSAAEFGGGIINDGRNAGSATLTVTNSWRACGQRRAYPYP
jgi:hypothetical protein